MYRLRLGKAAPQDSRILLGKSSIGNRRVKVVRIKVIFIFLIIHTLHLPTAQGENLELRSKLELSDGASSASSVDIGAITVSKSNLAKNANLTVFVPNAWTDLGAFITAGIQETYKDYSKKFTNIPPLSTRVRLMSKDTFHKELNLPSWTNAIFFRGEIVLPVNSSTRFDLPELARSVKHEYVHALIHEMGGGKAPGWLDEGLAQWSEGSTHPALPKIFRSWLSTESFLPFSSLGKGFTQLSSRTVPVAYAQSLYSTKELIDRFGFPHLNRYFNLLRTGKDSQQAFLRTFGESEEQFGRKAEAAVRLAFFNPL
jgi:hypothetical protein